MVVLREESRDFSIGDDGRGIEIENLFIRVSKKVLLDLIEKIGGYDEDSMKRIRRLKKDGVANFIMANFATDERGEISHPPLTMDLRGKPRKKKSKSLRKRKEEDPNPKHVKSFVKGTKKGGFLQALALPVAEYFINNPDSELNPANRRNQMANEFSQGNFKPKKTGLLGMFGR
jgi:hypothetical protein